MTNLEGLRLYYHPYYYDIVAEFALGNNFDVLYRLCRGGLTHGIVDYDLIGGCWFTAELKLSLNGRRYFVGADQETNSIKITTDPDLVASGDEDYDLHNCDGGYFQRGIDPATQWQLFIAPLRMMHTELNRVIELEPDDCPRCYVKIRPEGGHLCGECGRDI
jgi:hypothetical protein